MANNGRRHRSSGFSWLLLIVWVAVIWGHSLMSGQQSSLESGLVVSMVRKVAYGLYSSENPLFMRIVQDHPSIMEILADSGRLSFYVRKAAHFSEYFVLGLLAFNAVRATFRHPLISLCVVGAIWVAVPNLDELIQRFVPGRAGMSTDVMIDMSGFALAIALCLPFALIGALLHKD